MQDLNVINALIDEAEKTPKIEVEFVGVTEKINKALKTLGSEGKRELAKEIFRSLVTGDHPELGEYLNKRSGNRLMFTLTATERQFRVWYSRPNSIRSNHVDSMGSGVLVGVYGDPEEVKKYVNDFTEVYPLRPITLPNGTKLFLRWGQDGEMLGHMGA